MSERTKVWNDVEEHIDLEVQKGNIHLQNFPKGPGQWPERSVEDILGVCVHQNAGRVDRPEYTAAYHTSPDNHITPGRGLPSLVYTFAITKSGTIFYATKAKYRTYGQGASDKKGYPGDENTHLIAVLVMGDFDGEGHDGATDNPTRAQMGSLAWLIKFLQALFRIPPEGIFGHYHFGKAACPGRMIKDWIESERACITPVTATEWQQWLKGFNPKYLPKYGVDGDWGNESKRALVDFQRKNGMRVTAVRDPFTRLKLKRLIAAKQLEVDVSPDPDPGPHDLSVVSLFRRIGLVERTLDHLATQMSSLKALLSAGGSTTFSPDNTTDTDGE
jgi:hypothetical protein